jgi:tetratricopeptide (TPR) repeat protein
MPFGVERREGPALDGFSLDVSPVQGVREFLANQREAPEGVISEASEEGRTGTSETLLWAPEPTDVTLSDIDTRDGLAEPGLATAAESSESEVPGPQPESIEASEVEVDPTHALEGGLEQILATHRDEQGASIIDIEEPTAEIAEAVAAEEPDFEIADAAVTEPVLGEVEPEVEEQTTDLAEAEEPVLEDADIEEPAAEIAEAEEPVLEDADVEPFAIETHEPEEVSSEPAARPIEPPPGVRAESTDATEPDVEVVDFDPAVSEFEVELPEPPPEPTPESVEPEPAAPVAESSPEIDGVAAGAGRAATLEPAGDGLSDDIATPAPARLSTGTAHATSAHGADGEDAFREWVASASAPILRRALTELELRAELDKVLLVTDRLLELDPGPPQLYRKRIEYLAAFGDQPLLVAAYIDLGVCLEKAGEMPEAVAVYEDLSRIDPGNAAAASALQRLQDVARGVAKQEEAAESADPIDDMRERAAMGGGSSTSGYLHPDLVKSGILDSPAEEAPRPYSGVSGGRDAGADFEQLLSEFRQELHERPQEANSLTHTEVGANLKAMGKIDDAIRELQTAVREPEAPTLAYELLGEAFLDKGQARVAMRLLKQALEDRSWDDREMLGVLYQLGVSYQELGELPNALGCYERIFSVDIDYKDVQQRILNCS